MTTHVRFERPHGEVVATIENYEWTVENDDFDKPILPTLNFFLDDEVPSDSDPQTDVDMAELVAFSLDGEVIT